MSTVGMKLGGLGSVTAASLRLWFPPLRREGLGVTSFHVGMRRPFGLLPAPHVCKRSSSPNCPFTSQGCHVPAFPGAFLCDPTWPAERPGCIGLYLFTLSSFSEPCQLVVLTHYILFHFISYYTHLASPSPCLAIQTGS